MRKRLLSLLLILVMVLGLIPAIALTARAETTEAEYVGGVTATGGTVSYDSSSGAYVPAFSTLYALDTDGAEAPNEITVSSLYTSDALTSSNKLTTAPVAGTTYYACLSVHNPGGSLQVNKELVDIQINGYKVTYLGSYESDMGFTSRIEYSLTKLAPEVWVGGVGIPSGYYLAVGSTTPTASKPSGGYAYYENKKLTLHNYSYSGQGYNMGSGLMAAIYSPTNVTVTLSGTNTLTQTAAKNSYGIYGDALVTIAGNGSLTLTGATCGIRAQYGAIINGGTIDASGNTYGIYGSYLTVNGGTVMVKALGGTGMDYAIRVDNSFTVANGLIAVASTATTGPYSAYDYTQRTTYDRILVSQSYIYVGGIHLPAAATWPAVPPLPPQPNPPAVMPTTIISP